MSKENDAVETIIKYKANKMKRSKTYANYIKSILNEHKIISRETSEETVGVFVKVFKMGAVDAMIYDIGAALDFTKKKKKRSVDDDDDVDDWTSQPKRKEMLNKIFPNSISGKDRTP